ncbi:MAG TPA: hypothetical protein VJL84_06695, partial [Kiloniellales bacterium]|nr:hypothetical protein [Kiloniellales bacterium]
MQRSLRACGAAVLALLLGLAGAPAFAVDDIDSDCPVFEGRTHAQILQGVEGRLKGDWKLAIRTTERSAKRIKDKGGDPTEALLFVEVLKCLQQEVAAGRHADAVAQAKADPRSGQGAPSGSGSSSSSSSSSGDEPVVFT